VSALVCGSILFLLEPCALQEVCTFEGLWEAIYFVLVGMTTVGYGDMVPVTAWAPVWKSNIQPDFNVRVIERIAPESSAELRELDESNRFVQKSAESTSI
jgi:GH24 family phage-related lysozyme (muramidase)